MTGPEETASAVTLTEVLRGEMLEIPPTAPAESQPDTGETGGSAIREALTTGFPESLRLALEEVDWLLGDAPPLSLEVRSRLLRGAARGLALVRGSALDSDELLKLWDAELASVTGEDALASAASLRTTLEDLRARRLAPQDFPTRSLATRTRELAIDPDLAVQVFERWMVDTGPAVAPQRELEMADRDTDGWANVRRELRAALFGTGGVA